MLNHILGLILVAGITLPVVQPSPSSENELLRRAETVYVTVTEFRYVPINALQTAPAYSSAAFVPAPSFPSTAAAPTPIPTLAPLVTWERIFDDALTLTSHAGLLTTMAPDFYPVHSLPDSSLTAMPTIAQPVLVVPPYTPTPSMQVLTPVQSTAIPVSESTTNRAPPTPLVTTPPVSRQSSTDTQSIENTDISTDTEESTTTTSKDVTLSTTSVEIDGTTTMSTEHPTTTRPRGSQNTSGAQPGQSRGKIMRGPSIGSTLGYLGALVAPSAGWQAILTAMSTTIALPSILVLLL